MRILALYFAYAFEYRSRSFVWFLVALWNPLILLTYWKAVASQNGQTFGGWGDAKITSYYLLLVIVGAMLIAHVEEEIAKEHIQGGGLSNFLLRPFSYLRFNFLSEIPWRVIQGFFGLLVLFCILLFTNIPLALTRDGSMLIAAIIIAFLGYCISFMLSMNIGILAFWFVDYSGLANVIDILILIFAGFIMPIEFLPPPVRTLAMHLPFAYSIYFPILVVQGGLATNEIIKIGLIQIFWIGLFYLTYKILWTKGLRKFTGVGQ